VETVDIVSILERFGLPIAMLFGGAWLTVTGKVVPGPTHEDVKKQRDRALELVYEIAHGLKQEIGDRADAGRGQSQKGKRGAD
jgi:hypothetical protein